MNAAAQEYLESRVLTAPPQSLHLLVVDGALRHAAKAAAAFSAGDREAAHQALDDARAFVSELIGGVDKEASPEMAANVAALFTFAYRRLVEAGLYDSEEKIRDAERVLRMHRETWVELLERLSGDADATNPLPANTSAVPANRRVLAEYDDYEGRSWSG